MVGRKGLFILLAFTTAGDGRGWGGMAAQEGLPGGSVRRWCHSSVRCQPRNPTPGPRAPLPAPRAGGAASPVHNKLFVPTFPLPPARERGAAGNGPGGPRLPVRGTGWTVTQRAGDKVRPLSGLGEGALLGVFSLLWLLLFFPPPQGEGKEGGSWGRSSQSRELFGSSVIQKPSPVWRV